MSVRPFLDQVGQFKVERILCPHSSKLVANTYAPSGILHTTEGWWDSAIAEFKHKFAPHFLLGLKDRKAKTYGIAQLTPIGYAGSACRGHNDQAYVQIEMVGFSQEHLWLPDQQTLDILASLFMVCEKEYGIPLFHPWKDGDFGLAGSSVRNKHRKAGFLGKVAGWYGHGDMPDPDVHWDPGCLEWSKIFARAKELQAASNLVA